MSPSAPAFELHDVSYDVDGRTLVRAPSLSFSSSRVTGLIGPNGSGKTTLVRLMARQERPSSGRIRFEGRPLEAWGSREFARRVAYLPQSPPRAEGMTVGELVALGRYPWHGPLGRFGSEDRRLVEEALELTGVVPFRDRLVDTLSGGERQRVWIAMLVAQDADCLLLDEPTSALDVAQQSEVMKMVRELSHGRDVGVVVVLHDVNAASKFCDRLVALREGGVIAEGSPRELMRDEVLERIYGVPMGVLEHPSSGTPIGYVR